MNITLKKVCVTASFLVLLLSYDVSSAQVQLYSAAAVTCDNPAPATDSVLYVVDPANGSSVPVGPIGFQGVTGMAFLGDGRLVASAQADTEDTMIAIFLEIDPLTGQGSLIGPIGDSDTSGQCGRAPDLTYDPATDTLHAIGRRCSGVVDGVSVLMAIDQVTGEGSIVGSTGIDGTGGNGLAIRSDGTLFWQINSNGSKLFTIDPETGLATQIALMSQQFSNESAFAFHPLSETLYASNLNPPEPFAFPEATLETINTTNGDISTIGRLPDCADALIFRIAPPSNVPALSQWAFLGLAGVLGVVGLMVLRKRASA